MKKSFVFILLIICQTFVFAQDKKIMKIAKYIEKGKGEDARKLLDELDGKTEYQNDIYYWYVRTVYYRNKAHTDFSTNKDFYKMEIAEARKSFEKLVELDKTDQSKSLSAYIPQIKKDLYEGENETTNKSITNTKTTENSQPEDNSKIVTLTEIGQGKSKEDAKYKALRNAIESAFGTFISSKTDILNDELLKDEIVSVTNGNIQKFEILSERQMPDGSYTSVVKATVSVTKLKTYFEGKGAIVEFKGGLFAANIKIQELNLGNEEKIMDYVFYMAKEIIKKGTWDYTISAKPPKSMGDGNWLVPLTVEASLKYSNFAGIIDIINGVKMSESEVSTYKEFDQDFYKMRDIFLRSPRSVAQILYLSSYLIPVASINFIVSNGIEEYNFKGLRCAIEGGYGDLTHQSTGSISRIFFPRNGGGLYTTLCDYIRGYDPDKNLLSQNDEQSINEFYSSIHKSFYGYSVDESQCFFFGDKLNTFTCEFRNILSPEELSRISEYKIKPFIKN